jgi:DNA-binding protein Fis
MNEAQLEKTLVDFLSETQSFTKLRGNRYIIAGDLVDRVLITHAMERAGYNKRQAAQMLGCNRNTIRKKISAYGLKFPMYEQREAS